MSNSNFQDAVGLSSNTFVFKGDALQIGTGGASKSVVFSNSVASQALVANPTANRTITLPDATGTLGLITAISAAVAGSMSNGQLVFSNSNGISFGINGSTITASAAGIQAIGVNTQATVVAGTVAFSNSNGISFGINGSTITAQMPSVSFWENRHDQVAGNPVVAGSLSLQRISVGYQISATEFDVLGHITNGGSSQGTYSMTVGLYTMSGSTASLASSSSTSASFASGSTTNNSATYGGQSGTRWRSMGIGTFNVTPGEYMLGILASVDGPAGSTMTLSLYGGSAVSVNAAPGGGDYNAYFADGIFSGGATTALPNSLHITDVNQTGVSVNAQAYARFVGTF